MKAMNPSVALTEGVRVSVTSHYLKEQSDPRRKRYVWGYTVRISNESPTTVQLITRHWIITDGTGKVDEVKGPGVVGKQPVLNEGDSFEYSSGCVLRTPRGRMEGTYQMVCEGREGFDALVAPFSLEMPFALN